MNAEELQEKTEHAHHTGQKAIGLTTAIVAVLLAVAMLLSHRAHTEEIKLQTKVNDGWAFYQAKHERAYIFGIEADKALAGNQKELAARYLDDSIDEECGVPAEKGCSTPMAKRSRPLQQFIKEHTGSSEGGETGQPEKVSPDSAVAGHEGGTKRQAASRNDGAADLQEKTRELEKETALVTRRADFYDAAELFLEVSIVLCSIALLAEARLYWRFSFFTTLIGIGVALWGWFLK